MDVLGEDYLNDIFNTYRSGDKTYFVCAVDYSTTAAIARLIDRYVFVKNEDSPETGEFFCVDMFGSYHMLSASQLAIEFEKVGDGLIYL
jgi:hypothetical protein